MDECLSLPCANGGTCRESGSALARNATVYASIYDQYWCTMCTVGFVSGEHGRCEDDVDECLSQPCANNATCVESASDIMVIQADKYRCVCAAGFVNGYCQHNYLYAFKALCHPCSHIHEHSSRQCQTQHAHSNSGNCDIDVDECISTPCGRASSCTESSRDNTVRHRPSYNITMLSYHPHSLLLRRDSIYAWECTEQLYSPPLLMCQCCRYVHYRSCNRQIPSNTYRCILRAQLGCMDVFALNYDYAATKHAPASCRHVYLHSDLMAVTDVLVVMIIYYSCSAADCC